MRSPLPLLTLLGATLVLGGCCSFFPCHPGTYIAGKVVDGVSKQAIANAAVHLYFYEARTAQSGCFALGGADGLPFEFGVSAPGYKPLVVPAHGGSYQAAITLVPQGSTAKSIYQATSISSAQYAELSRGCP